MALLATDWHWLPRCMQSLNAASEVCAQQQPARSLHATGSLYVNDAIAQAHARRCVSLMCMQRPCIGIACHAVQQSKQHGARCMIQHRQHFHLDDDRNNIHAATRYAQSSLQTAAYAYNASQRQTMSNSDGQRTRKLSMPVSEVEYCSSSLQCISLTHCHLCYVPPISSASNCPK